MSLTSLVRGEEREEMSRKVLYLARSFWLVKNLSFIGRKHIATYFVMKSIYRSLNPFTGMITHLECWENKRKFVLTRIKQALSMLDIDLAIEFPAYWVIWF